MRNVGLSYGKWRYTFIVAKEYGRPSLWEDGWHWSTP